jgi:hypothetical protein
MISAMIVMIDEVSDLRFEVFREEVVFEQNAVLQRLVPALDLALGLGVSWRTVDLLDGSLSQPLAQVRGDVASGVRSAFALLLPEPYVHLSAHTALHSNLAHGHGNIMIARGDGAAGFTPENVWIDLRIAPTELSLRA